VVPFRPLFSEVIDWLQFYNHRRLHSTLGYLSPMARASSLYFDAERPDWAMPLLPLDFFSALNDDLSTIGKIVEIVRPLLHHTPALGEVLRVVVGGADLVAFVMGKLAFDAIGMKTHFV
jgi:hypothetical protein